MFLVPVDVVYHRLCAAVHHQWAGVAVVDGDIEGLSTFVGGSIGRICSSTSSATPRAQATGRSLVSLRNDAVTWTVTDIGIDGLWQEISSVVDYDAAVPQGVDLWQ